MEIFGLPADTYKGPRAFKTKLISCNLFNVVYNDTVLKFPMVFFFFINFKIKFYLL